MCWGVEFSNNGTVSELAAVSEPVELSLSLSKNVELGQGDVQIRARKGRGDTSTNSVTKGRRSEKINRHILYFTHFSLYLCRI